MVTIVSNGNAAEFLDVGLQTTNNIGAPTVDSVNQTTLNQNNTLPDLEVEPNIALAKTSAFYAIILADFS